MKKNESSVQNIPNGQRPPTSGFSGSVQHVTLSGMLFKPMQLSA